MRSKLLLCLALITTLVLACAPPPAPSSTATPPPEPAPVQEVTPLATAAPEPTAAPTQPPQPTPPAKEVASSLEPVFEPGPCPFALPPDEEEGETIQCGFVAVPEQRSDPETDTIRLAVVVLKSLDDNPQPDPVILLAGGPGEKTVNSAIPAANILAPFRENRDVIVFDQRGVGLSEPALDCPEIVQARFDLIDEIDTEVALRTLYEATVACHGRLVEEGHNLAAYNTTENAADVDDIRRALGYEQLNLYGGSYGSLLAQAILRDHPEGVRSAIIGAVLPAEKSFFVNVPTTAVSATLRLLDACEADAACNAAYPDLEQTLYDTVEKLNSDPVPITLTSPVDGRTYDAWLTGDDVFSNLMLFLYFTDIIPVLPQAVYNVANGDYGLMTQLTSQRLALFDALSTGMEFSVLCAEDLIGKTPQDYLAERAKMPPALAGREDPEDIIEYSIFGLCDAWSVPEADPSVKVPVESDIPTLILEGEFDPVTPLVYAEAVAQHLPNSYVYEFPAVGHTVLVSSPCARTIAADFIEDPTQEPDTSCLEGLTGVVFDLPQEEQAGITLEPFTVEQTGLSGVAPAGWTEAGPGVYLRQQNALDPTALVYDVAPADEAGFVQLLQAQLRLAEAPEAVGVRATETYTWTLYSITVQGIEVDVATASDEDRTVFVLMQSQPQERDALLESVFVPAMDALKPIAGD